MKTANRMISLRRPTSEPYSSLHCYGLSKYVPFILLAGLILLVPIDWAFPSGPRAERQGLPDAERLIPQTIRAGLLGLMMLYILLGGLDPGKYRFTLGRPLISLAGFMFVSIVAFSQNVASDMLILSKTAIWIVGAIAFYRLTISGNLSSRQIVSAVGVVMVLASFCTIRCCLRAGAKTGQNADAYLLLWCIPLILLNGPSIRALGLVGLASVAIVFTLKRGAILALVVSMLAYLFVLTRLFTRNRSVGRLVTMVFIVGAIVVLGLLLQWDELLYRMKDFGDPDTIGSGRGVFYRTIISNWYNGGVPVLFYGRGCFSVPSTLDKHIGYAVGAHSDWLEVLHDMGLLGVAVLVAVHMTIISTIAVALRMQHPLVLSLVMGYCIFAMANVYSQCVIGNVNTVFFALLLGHGSAEVQADVGSKGFLWFPKQ